MRCFKLHGERVMSRDFDRQVANLQVMAAFLNRFTALGTPPATRRIGQYKGKGKPAVSRFSQQSRNGASLTSLNSASRN